MSIRNLLIPFIYCSVADVDVVEMKLALVKKLITYCAPQSVFCGRRACGWSTGGEGFKGQRFRLGNPTVWISLDSALSGQILIPNQSSAHPYPHLRSHPKPTSTPTYTPYLTLLPPPQVGLPPITNCSFAIRH